MASLCGFRLTLVRAGLFALAGLAGAVSAQSSDPAARAAQEAAAQRQLATVRAEIEALAAAERQSRDERDDLVASLRERELALAAVASEVHELDEQIGGQQARLADLEARRAALEASLAERRAELAALLRSAYALGRHEELRALLRQDDFGKTARVLAYHHYFERAQAGQIERTLADLEELAVLQDTIHRASAELERALAERAAEAERLAAERAERAELLAAIERRLIDQRARRAALGRDQARLEALLERLRDVFADIPPEIASAEPLASRRGRLDWPLRGRLAQRFGARDESGRASSGILIAAADGSPVHAIWHGRIAFADWLRGYGLLLIVDHGDGYLSLYGGNEALLKEVGDWVDAGQTIALSGTSGGERVAGLYFELRAAGKPLDPRTWLRK